MPEPSDWAPVEKATVPPGEVAGVGLTCAVAVMVVFWKAVPLRPSSVSVTGKDATVTVTGVEVLGSATVSPAKTAVRMWVPGGELGGKGEGVGG